MDARTWLRFTPLLLLTLFASTGVAQNGTPRVRGELLLQLRAQSTAAQRARFEELARKRQIRHVRAILDGRVQKYRVSVQGDNDTEESLARELMATGVFNFVEPNYFAEPLFVPNDTRFPEQWHHAKIGTPEAWDTVVGDPSALIVVCDGGFDVTHPDLAGNLALPGYNIVDGSTNVRGPIDHGTAVTGVLAAVGNNGLGIAGVLLQAHVMPVLMTTVPGGNASYENIARCIEYAADQGARVVNLSYGPTFGNGTVYAAGGYLRERGGLLVASAGNNSFDTSGFSNTPNILAVGATTNIDTRASFSNYGPWVDVMAPGEGILVTAGGTTFISSGTSFAAPIVSGVAALLFAVNPGFTPAAVEDILFTTAVDLGAPGNDNLYANGRVDAAAAVADAVSRVTQDVQAPYVEFASPGGEGEGVRHGATVHGIVTLAVNATDDIGVTSVRFSVDSNQVVEVTTLPFEAPFDTALLFNGWHEFAADAFDAAGHSSRAVVWVYVDNELWWDTESPSVSIVSPADGATVRDATKIVATAADNAGVTMVWFWIDDRDLYADWDAPYTRDLNTKELANGWHQIWVGAHDAVGHSTWTSSWINVVNE